MSKSERRSVVTYDIERLYEEIVSDIANTHTPHAHTPHHTTQEREKKTWLSFPCHKNGINDHKESLIHNSKNLNYNIKPVRA